MIELTQADRNITTVNAGLSVINSIAGSLLSTKAFEAQIKADTDARIANMDSVMSNYEYEATKLNQEIGIMDSMFGDKVSERQLQSMKDYATLKAAAAETGTSGGSTTEATIQAHADAAFDIAIINQKRKASRYSALREMEKSRMEAYNSLKALKSGGVNYESNPVLAGLAGFSSAMGGILASMPNNVRAEVFGYDPNAANLDPDIIRYANQDQGLMY